MKNKDQLTALAVTVASSFALAFVLYNLALSIRESGFFTGQLRRKQKKSDSKGKLKLEIHIQHD